MVQLIEHNWIKAPTVMDAIYGILVDTPDHYYLTPGRRLSYMLIRGKGLAEIHKDFRMFNDDEVAEWMFHMREELTS